MTWNEFLSSQTFGIILGAFLTAGFTWFIEWRKSIIEDRKHIRDKREEVYEQLLTILMPIYNSWILSKIDKKFQKKPFDIEHIEILLNMYGSQKILWIFNDLPLTHWEISSETIDVIKKLKKQMRKELGIRD